MDFFIVLAQYKKFIIGFTFLVALVTAAIAIMTPNVYHASVKLLPPQSAQSSASALLSQLGGAVGITAGGVKNPNDLYLGILKSRAVADGVIDRLNLMQAYDLKSREDARTTLTTNTLISSSKEGLITIEVEDQDKKLVAKIANGYVEELLRLTKVLATTEAGKRRIFFEKQLELSKNNLEKAELTLKNAIGRGGVISVDSESRAVLETVSKLRAQISATEIQLNSMRAFVTTSNPEFQRTQEKLISLKAELFKLENGRPDASASAAPGRLDGLENIKVLRELKYHQQLYEILAKQYEVGRLDEAKDSALIQVLDPAIEPERKIKPKRAVMVIISGILGVFFAITFCLLWEFGRRALADPRRAAKWELFKHNLRFGK